MRTILYLSILFALPLLAAAAGNGERVFYVGTYTGSHSKGIYAYRFQPATGEITEIGVAAETQNPSFLAVHPNAKFLYAVNETGRGSVSAFRIDEKTGKLTLLNKVSSKGAGPCALAVDHTGKYVLVANYSSGSAALLPIKEDGSLGEASAFDQHTGSSVNRERQGEAHAHSAVFSPDNRFALVCDLGVDKVYVYRFDAAKGTLTAQEPGKVPPGSGPRHIAFHPNGKYAYVINELTSTVTAFGWNAASGRLTEIEDVASLPKDYTGEKSGAEIHVHPNGKFLYASNRAGASEITVFAIGPDGKLAVKEYPSSGGKEPRYFGFDPTGNYILGANQNSDNIAIFRVDPKTGKLTATGKQITVSKPVCVEFAAAK